METNEQGNQIIRGFVSVFHYGLITGPHWTRYNTEQDCSYFGIWINPETFQTFTYAEGDTTLVNCTDAAGYKKELKAMDVFYNKTED